MAIITGDILYDFIGVLTAIVVIFVIYCKWAFQYWKERDVPYFKPSIPWGNLRAPHRRTISLPEEVTEIYRKANVKGWKHMGMFNITTPVYLPLDLDIIKCIMTKDFNHFVDRGVYVNEKDDPLTAHLFSIGGKKWRTLRAKFTPTFTSGKMRIMFQIIEDCGVKLEKYLEQNYQEPVDIKNVLGNFSTDVIGSCAFGIECNSFIDPNNQFRIMGNKAFNRTKLEDLKIAIGLNFPNFAKFLRLRIFDKFMSDFFTKVVADTMAYREKNNVNRNDFLQLLMDIKNKEEVTGSALTLNDIAAQSFVFFLAGFETSSTTMTFTLYELSQHQDIQDKVREEIMNVLKKHDGKVTYDVLHDLKYMSQVIDETLRLFPPVPFITRVCVEDYVVPDTDLKIEKGVKVFIPVKGIHFDEKYYKDPETFDPERFSDENKRSRNQYSYMPFGEGPRMCIGMRFGIMQTKIGLFHILRNFKVTLNKRTQLPLKMMQSSFVPQAEGGMWLNLERI